MCWTSASPGGWTSSSALPEFQDQAVNVHLSEKLRAQSRDLTVHQAHTFLNDLSRARDMLERNVIPRLVLEWLMLEMPVLGRTGRIGEAVASIAGVRLKRSGPVLYYDAGALEISVNDFVMVETDDGDRLGRVAFTPDQLLLIQLREYAGHILRPATEDDLNREASPLL